MTDIMLNMPRKVVQEYSTPMMFCTVPTDPPAAFHTINQNADTMSKNLPSNHLWVEHVLVMALYAVIATNAATCGTCVAVSLQQKIPLCVRHVGTLCNATQQHCAMQTLTFVW